MKNGIEKIDEIDRKILRILAPNARIAIKDVAESCNLSRAAVHQRVQRMIDNKTILSATYQLNPRVMGYNTCTYVGLRLEKGSLYKAVAEELNNIPEVVECHFTTGPYTMLIKLYARDNQHLMDLLNGRIQGIAGVVTTETLISLDQSIKREIPQ